MVPLLAPFPSIKPLLYTLEKLLVWNTSMLRQGLCISPKGEELEEKIDEGFDEELIEPYEVNTVTLTEELATVAPPSDSESYEVRTL